MVLALQNVRSVHSEGYVAFDFINEIFLILNSLHQLNSCQSILRYHADAPTKACFGFDPGGQGIVRVASRASIRTRTGSIAPGAGNDKTLSK